ncbi:uncharacterized protein DS421_18g611630 [Arachis hypogaea]|nr:uncharacterized protein DS421_18g611630 [Arachis hypogaea]
MLSAVTVCKRIERSYSDTSENQQMISRAVAVPGIFHPRREIRQLISRTEIVAGPFSLRRRMDDYSLLQAGNLRRIDSYSRKVLLLGRPSALVDLNSTPERLCFSHTQSPSSALSPSSWPFPYLRPATASCRRRRSFQQPPSARSPSLHHAAAIDINLPFHCAEIATFLRRAATPPPVLSLFSATTVPVRSPFEGTPPLSWSLGVSISHRAAIATFLRRAATPPPALSLFSATTVPVRSPFEGTPPLSWSLGVSISLLHALLKASSSF